MGYSDSPLLITDSAVEKIKSLIDSAPHDSFGIRIGIKSGGCSGFVYYIEYADDKKSSDTLIQCRNNVNVLIDSRALMYIIGSTMDYVDTQFKSGFAFFNPNEKAKCGCGNSFSI